MNLVDKKIQQYAEQCTSDSPYLLCNLIGKTFAAHAAPEMLVGKLEGRLLKLLVQLSGARTVLEIGMFTGYSALSMAEGLPSSGRLITCEVNEAACQTATQFFSRSPHGYKIELCKGPALETLKTLTATLDMAFLDADKANNPIYYEIVLEKLKSGGLIVIDNTLRNGQVLDPQSDVDKITARLNEQIKSDPRVEVVLLPIRDGLSLIRKCD